MLSGSSRKVNRPFCTFHLSAQVGHARAAQHDGLAAVFLQSPQTFVANQRPGVLGRIFQVEYRKVGGTDVPAPPIVLLFGAAAAVLFARRRGKKVEAELDEAA